jgi:hypothetical protein
VKDLNNLEVCVKATEFVNAIVGVYIVAVTAITLADDSGTIDLALFKGDSDDDAN